MVDLQKKLAEHCLNAQRCCKIINSRKTFHNKIPGRLLLEFSGGSSWYIIQSNFIILPATQRDRQPNFWGVRNLRYSKKQPPSGY